MQIELSGRTALISGGSQGLGLAAALRLAESGADVAILARRPQVLEQARQQIQARAPQRKVVAVACDLGCADGVNEGYARARAALGPIDILLNNVGGHALGRFEEVSDAQWDHDLQIKLMATVRLTRLCWPEMIARRWGRVMGSGEQWNSKPTYG